MKSTRWNLSDDFGVACISHSDSIVIFRDGQRIEIECSEGLSTGLVQALISAIQSSGWDYPDLSSVGYSRDDTDHLTSTEANREALSESIAEVDDEEVNYFYTVGFSTIEQLMMGEAVKLPKCVSQLVAASDLDQWSGVARKYDEAKAENADLRAKLKRMADLAIKPPKLCGSESETYDGHLSGHGSPKTPEKADKVVTEHIAALGDDVRFLRNQVRQYQNDLAMCKSFLQSGLPVIAAQPDRLERIATAAMQGMLSHQTRYKPRPGDPQCWHEAIAKEAGELARALIADLDG